MERQDSGEAFDDTARIIPQETKDDHGVVLRGGVSHRRCALDRRIRNYSASPTYRLPGGDGFLFLVGILVDSLSQMQESMGIYRHVRRQSFFYFKKDQLLPVLRGADRFRIKEQRRSSAA